MEIDFTKPVEAYHEDGRTMPISSIHPWGNDQWPWCGVADTEHIYMGRHGCSRSTYGDMPGWRIRNRKPEERFTPASECASVTTNTTPINRELWERCELFLRDICATTDPAVYSWQIRAREIVKLLPKPAIDPDLLEARKIAAAPFDLGIRQEYLDGKNDHHTRVKELLSTLKRGRELERGE